MTSENHVSQIEREIRKDVEEVAWSMALEAQHLTPEAIEQLFGALKRDGATLSIDEMDASVAAALWDDDEQSKR